MVWIRTAVIFPQLSIVVSKKSVTILSNNKARFVFHEFLWILCVRVVSPWFMTNQLSTGITLDRGTSDQEPSLEAPENPQMSEQRPDKNARRQTHTVPGGSQHPKCHPETLRPQVKNLCSTNGVLCRNRKKKKSKTYVESQRNLKGQNNLEKEQKSWRPHTSWFPNILQNYSNENSMV